MLLSRNANDGIAKIISFSPVGNNARQPTCEDDTRGVKVDQMAPLFMLPPLYNGYTNYTCPPNEEDYDEGSDVEGGILEKPLRELSTAQSFREEVSSMGVNRVKASNFLKTQQKQVQFEMKDLHYDSATKSAKSQTKDQRK